MSDDVGLEYKRVFGEAEYYAEYIQRSNLVRLTARGILRCQNYNAELEMRPERVIPPMWDLVFYISDFCIRSELPFRKEVIFVATGNPRGIIVRDSRGETSVPIHMPSLVNVKGSDVPWPLAER